MGVVVRFREGDYLVPVNVISTEGNLAHVLPVNSGFMKADGAGILNLH